MNRLVYLVTELGETCLGTVQSIITPGDGHRNVQSVRDPDLLHKVRYDESGPGQSLTAVFMDLVANLIEDGEGTQQITLRLGE